MNIKNFESYVNQTVLDRGYSYYIEGNIVEAYNQGNNEYAFEVQGSEDYEVIVKLDNKGEIIYSECDCPYDFGPICKHEVAAYFKLFEIIDNDCIDLSSKEKASNSSGIKGVLNNLSKEELVKIILDIAQENRILKNSLILRYSKGNNEQELEKCKRLIESIIIKYTCREGFIRYRDTYSFANEMQEILEKASITEDIMLALEIAFLLINEAIEAFEYADDSDGGIGSLVVESIEFIENRVLDIENLDKDLKETIFNKLLEQIDSDVFDGWENYRIDILTICVNFAGDANLREKLRTKIESILLKNSRNEYEIYYDEQLMNILLQIINSYGTKEETLEFIENNLKYDSFRAFLIDKFMKENKFQKVIELAEEGELRDNKYNGSGVRWKKIRYEAYKKLYLKDEQRLLAKQLLFDGNFEYYNELRELNAGDDKEFYNKIKKELKTGKSWHCDSMYLKLILQENDLDEIMEYVKANPRNIESYANMLKTKFKDEVIVIYENHIKIEASNASNRKSYQAVCGIIKRYKTIAGKKNKEDVINELTELYRKKPAFVDELGKIK